MVAFDLAGVTGHRDHVRAPAAAVAGAAAPGLEALGWTLPSEVAGKLAGEHAAGFIGHEATAIDLVLTVDPTRQLEAIAQHRSQAVPSSVLWRRLELLGNHEHPRWLC